MAGNSDLGARRAHVLPTAVISHSFSFSVHRCSRVYILVKMQAPEEVSIATGVHNVQSDRVKMECSFEVEIV